MDLTPYTHVVALPNANSIIDLYDPEADRTLVNGRPIELVRQENPDAIVLTHDDWCEQKAARQDTPIRWEPITEVRYEELLNCLPPRLMRTHAFLVGEPTDHHALSGAPRFAACWHRGEDEWLASTRPITVDEFRALFGGRTR